MQRRTAISIRREKREHLTQRGGEKVNKGKRPLQLTLGISCPGSSTGAQPCKTKWKGREGQAPRKEKKKDHRNGKVQTLDKKTGK